MQFMRIAALGVIAALSLAASKANWTATINVTPKGSHVLGNPEAPAKLTEFVSYTCPHCATFQKQSDAPLRIAYVMPGKVSVEVQHVVRDPVDLTVAMLTNCGEPAGFFKRHHIFLHEQEKWLARMPSMSDLQKQRWAHGAVPVRLRAVARDFGFYALMEQRGYTRVRVDTCLGDMKMAEKLISQTQDATRLGVPGTPSFAINGALIENVHDWDSLKPWLKAAVE